MRDVKFRFLKASATLTLGVLRYEPRCVMRVTKRDGVSLIGPHWDLNTVFEVEVSEKDEAPLALAIAEGSVKVLE